MKESDKQYELNHLVEVWRDKAEKLRKSGVLESSEMGDDTYDYGEYCTLEECADNLQELLNRF